MEPAAKPDPKLHGVNPVAAGEAGPIAYSLVTLCVDRWDFLRVSLPTWHALPGVIRKTVVTCSFDKIPDWLTGVTVVVVETTQFHRTRNLNTGIFHVANLDRPSHLILIDADVIVKDPMVFDRAMTSQSPRPHYLLDSPAHAINQLRSALPDAQETDPENVPGMRGLRGTHVAWWPLLEATGGFDQRMRGWGLEDFNLFARYRMLSDRFGGYDRAGLEHQPHDDALRAKHNPPGSDFRSRVVANMTIHNTRLDVRGESWRKELGNPRYRVFER